MDTFMDKFAQRKKAQGMIDANAAADAANMEKLKRQVNEYELLLQEIRKVNLKTAENAGQMSRAIQAGIEKIEAFQADNEAYAGQEKILSEIKGQLEILLTELKKQREMFAGELEKQNEALSGEIKKLNEMFPGELEKQNKAFSGELKRQNEALSEEIKKLYEMFPGELKKQSETLSGELKKQNEALSGELKKQNEALSGELKKMNGTLPGELKELSATLPGEIKKQNETLSEEMKERLEAFLPELKKQVGETSKQSEDFFHKESVKVYRNVQAAMTEELSKQTEALTALQKESGKKQKAVLPLTIVILLLLLADIAVHLLNITLF